MRLKDYIERDLVLADPDVEDKDSLFRQLVETVTVRFPSLDGRGLFELLNAREEQVSTCVGHGVAVPHASVPGLERGCCVIARLRGGVEFDPGDEARVHIVFLLLNPPDRVGTHIRILARIARLVGNEDFLGELMNAADAQGIFEIVSREDDRHVS